MPTALIAQGGGPTPVINATLAGAILAARETRAYGSVLGAEHGLKGALEGRFIDLSGQSEALLKKVAMAPGAALGSSRDALRPEDTDRLVEVFRRHDIRQFFYIGGNGSMGTALDVERAARTRGYELQVIGVPKTVDNDLYGTDHTPGYGSAGRFYAHAVRDMGMDHRALPSPILICEVIGRNVGWIVAATAFARYYDDDAPNLIYCPERPLPRAKLLADIEAVYRRIGRVFVCICEGQRDEDGESFDADVDRPENPKYRLASNLAHAVSQYVARETKLRARSERPSLLGRSCAVLAAETDRAEAELVGRAAVAAAQRGATGVMVALEREAGAVYSVTTKLVALEEVARRERTLPAEFMGESGDDVTEAYRRYAAPLVGVVEPHARLA